MNRNVVTGIIVVGVAVVLMVLAAIFLPVSKSVWVWIAALLTLAIFSILYRDNPFYRVAEHLFIGLSLGYGLALTFHNALIQYVFQPIFIEGNLLRIIPMLIGLLYFTRIIPKASWMVRIPISVALGWSSGVAIPLIFRTSIFEQMRATLVTREMFADNIWLGIWGVVLLIGVITTLAYFFFSRKEKSPLKPVSQVGIFFIMIGFGATFGLTVMSRVSLLIGRLQFLLRDWLGVIQF